MLKGFYLMLLRERPIQVCSWIALIWFILPSNRFSSSFSDYVFPSLSEFYVLGICVSDLSRSTNEFSNHSRDCVCGLEASWRCQIDSDPWGPKWFNRPI